ncbi:hypothetical protein Agub_g1412, partial [Astrephomene gubernaculifera]
KALIEALKRPVAAAAAAAGGAGAGRRAVDYWRLLTVLQAAHVAVWHSAYEGGQGEEEDAATSELAVWLSTYLRCMEQALRGRQSLVMRVKVFLAEALSHYDA